MNDPDVIDRLMDPRYCDGEVMDRDGLSWHPSEAIKILAKEIQRLRGLELIPGSEDIHGCALCGAGIPMSRTICPGCVESTQNSSQEKP